jgi:pimeloyl-ACP methyl ester carboxylesterase
MNFYKIIFALLIMFTNSKLFSYEEGIALNGDLEIYYRDYGPKEAEPILLVQGIGGQLINWPEHLIDFLIENNFRPIVYDNRDTGLSSRVPSDSFSDAKRDNTIVKNYIRYYLRLPIKSDYTLDDMAVDGISVLDKLDISEAHILGISMGGMIAQIIVSSNPERTKTFTLIASTASTPSPFNGPTRKVRKLLMNRTKNPNSTVDERVARSRKIFTEIGYQGIDLNTEEFYNNVSISIERGGKDDTGFGRQLNAILASQNRLDKVKSISAPTLIIHGLEDPLIKVKNAYKANKLIKGSKLIIIDDMRHLIEPPVFNQFKDDLLEHLETNK